MSFGAPSMTMLGTHLFQLIELSRSQDSFDLCFDLFLNKFQLLLLSVGQVQCLYRAGWKQGRAIRRMVRTRL